MFLYHGTASVNVENILLNGLFPRKNNLGNWFTNIKSHSDLVYMIKDVKFSEQYALRSAIVNQDDRGAILKIDLDMLDKSFLRVDENFLDIEERGDFANCDIAKRQEQRSKAAQDTRWEESLSKFGCCTYFGVVPPEAISVKEIKNIESIPFFREEFVQYSEPSSNCYVYDTFLSNFCFHVDMNEWVYRSNINKPVPKVMIDIDHVKNIFEDVVD
jgi:hypothetical protein